MFKRLFLFSGLFAIIATAVLYLTVMVPDVDVRPMTPTATLTLDELVPSQLRNGDVMVIQGIVSRFGTTITGKTELVLVGSATSKCVFCSFIIGEPQAPFAEGDTIYVKGVWQSNPALFDSESPILGEMNDCIVAE